LGNGGSREARTENDPKGWKRMKPIPSAARKCWVHECTKFSKSRPRCQPVPRKMGGSRFAEQGMCVASFPEFSAPQWIKTRDPRGLRSNTAPASGCDRCAGVCRIDSPFWNPAKKSEIIVLIKDACSS
jgi:hypothetical protein